MQLHTFSIELLFDEEGFPLHLFDAILEFRGSPAKHRGESPEEVCPFILRIISGMPEARVGVPYLVTEPPFWIPQTPCNFLQVRTGIVQVLCIRMEYAKHGRIFNGYGHIFAGFGQRSKPSR